MTITDSNLKISWLLWIRLVWTLRKRGANRRESGAFLLGPLSGGRANHFICYDDLDPNCLDTGIIRFDGSGYVHLWKACSQKKLKVIADVHTHPSGWTGQSEADRTHPMVAQKGHLAMILPHYAQTTLLSKKGASLYQYLGDNTWKTLAMGNIQRTIF